MGVGDKAATIAVVGVTLGQSGGGLLIKGVSSGNIPKEDVFGVLSFLNLSHSVFEDTAVAMLLGPNLYRPGGADNLCNVVCMFDEFAKSLSVNMETASYKCKHSRTG